LKIINNRGNLFNDRIHHLFFNSRLFLNCNLHWFYKWRWFLLLKCLRRIFQGKSSLISDKTIFNKIIFMSRSNFKLPQSIFFENRRVNKNKLFYIKLNSRLKLVFRPCKYRSFEFSSLKLLILPFCPCKY